MRYLLRKKVIIKK